MSIARVNVDFAKRIFSDRVGNDYVYGGNWNPFNVNVGTDCSGLVIDELDACVNGTGMAWTRHGMSTESWRPVEVGQRGPFGTICVANPKDFPPDAVVKVAIHHGPGGGANSHMWCEVDGVRMESNGSHGCVTGNQARPAHDTSYANDWHYLPGPITTSNPGGAAVTGDPVWLPEVLRAEGLTVVELDGWRGRGHGDFGNIWGVVCHHTGSNNASAESIAFHPTLGLASQLHLSRTGVYTVCGAGVAWHAGNGSWPGLPTDGANQYTIGIEAANDGGGSPGKPHRSSWPDVQYDAYVRGVAAILRKVGQPQSHAIGHKEWAGAAQGKWDPGAIDMNIFRADIAARLGTPGGNEDMAQVPQQQWDRALFLLEQAAGVRRKSRSPFRWPGEGEIDTCAGFAWSADANIHVQLIEKLAVEYGDPGAVAVLVAVAKCADDPGKFPDRQADAKFAARILSKVDPESRTVGESQIQAWLAAEKN